MRSSRDQGPFGTNRDAVPALVEACRALVERTAAEAGAIIRARYPFQGFAKAGRRYSEAEMLRVFERDGFVDRYTGSKLVFPGTLRLLSILLPTEFPFHPNWKMDACHPAFWDLCPTIDHLVPVARGGLDQPDNWVTTSMRSNAAKANWTLEEVGWSLRDPGRVEEWDGLVGWFAGYASANERVVATVPYLQRWLRAAGRGRGR